MDSFKVDKNVNGTLSIADKFGNPVTGGFASPPTWSVDPAFASLAVADDGLSAVLTPTGVVGSTGVSVTGSLGGTAMISGSKTFDFVAGDVAAINISLAQ